MVMVIMIIRITMSMVMKIELNNRILKMSEWDFVGSVSETLLLMF